MAGYDDELVTEDNGENAPVTQEQPAGVDAAASNQDLSSQLGLQDVGTGDAGLDSVEEMPEPDDTEQKKGARNWLQQILDNAREAYGVNEGFSDPMSGMIDEPNREPAGLPKQAGGDEEEHEPTGLPEQAEGEDDTLKAKYKEDNTNPMDWQNPEEPSVDPKTAGLGDLVKLAAGKAVRQVGEAIAPSEEEKKLSTPQRGALPAAAERALRAYVTGDGGEPPEARRERERQVAGAVPDQNPSMVKAAALKQAQQTTPDGGVSTLQGYRKDYNNLKGAAAATLDKGDKEGSAKLYNEAQTNVGSGEHVTMVPTSKGMDAHIEMPDGKTYNVPLTDDQYRELLHKRVGEFDHIAERGILRNLQDLTKTAGLSQGHESYTGGQGVPTPTARPAQAPGGAGGPPAWSTPGWQQGGNNAPPAGTKEAAAQNAPLGGSAAPAPQRGSTLQRGGQGNPVNYYHDGKVIRILPQGTPYGPGGAKAGMGQDQTANMQRDAIEQDPRFKQRGQEIQNRADVSNAREEGRRLGQQLRHEDKGLDRDFQREKLEKVLGQKDRHLAYLQDKATNDRVSKDIGRDANAFLRNLNGKRQANPGYKPSDAEKQVEQQIITRAQSYGDQAVRQHLQTMGSGGNGAPAAPGTNQGGGRVLMQLPNGTKAWVRQ